MMASIFDIAGSGMAAQNLRLNLIASNLANANSTSSESGEAYRAKQPLFSSVLENTRGVVEPKVNSVGGGRNTGAAGVRVTGIVADQRPLPLRYDPGHAHANEAGYVEMSNVNMVTEMANMMAASRSYQSNVEIMNSSRQLMLRTLQIGR